MSDSVLELVGFRNMFFEHTQGCMDPETASFKLNSVITLKIHFDLSSIISSRQLKIVFQKLITTFNLKINSIVKILVSNSLE